MNKNKIKPKRQERDGVIYEPSNQYKNNADEDYLVPSESAKINKTKPPQKNYSPQYSTLIIITVLIGIIICVSVFFIVYSSITRPHKKSDSNLLQATETTSLSASEIIQNIENAEIGNPITGIIENIDANKKLFSIYALKEEKSYNLKASGSTVLKDRYGDSLAFSEFKSGDIVDFIYNEDKKLTSVIENKDSWQYKNENGIKINTDNKTITRNSTTFNYNNKTAVNYNNSKYDIKLINEMDFLTIKGYGNNVYSIEVEKSHGSITVNNASHIKDGSIEIDTSVYRKLSEVDSLDVSEGTHKIVVKGANSEPFSQEVYIKSGDVYNLDLSSVQLKSGVLLIKTNVSDFNLYVNNETELSREPLILNYGAYTIKVEKEGYENYETQISINKEQTTLNIELKKIEIEKETPIEKGTIKITTVPPNANLYIDNEYIGISPMTKEIEYGNHSITVKLEGYKQITLDSVTVNNKAALMYNFDLQPESQTTTTIIEGN